jgi:hypothetical protein
VASITVRVVCERGSAPQAVVTRTLDQMDSPTRMTHLDLSDALAQAHFLEHVGALVSSACGLDPIVVAGTLYAEAGLGAG